MVPQNHVSDAPKRVPLGELPAGYGPWLYRLYGADGLLLYIGKTVRPLRERFNQHKRTQQWWANVTSATAERFHADWACLDAERAAIRAERPAHNLRSAVR
jgi:hypothetical protein